jgi:serine protease AprX
VYGKHLCSNWQHAVAFYNQRPTNDGAKLHRSFVGMSRPQRPTPLVATPLPLGVRPVLPLPVRLKADTRPTGRGVGVAMVDSDFVSHPDFTQPVNRITAYYDAVNDAEYTMPPTVDVLPRHWHGTMTACTAVGNGHLSQSVFTSLAPNATAILIRTMNDEGRITTPVIVRALRWIADAAERLNIRVANVSVYADELDHTLDHPVNRAVEDLVASGIVVVAAVGNNPWSPVRPPAAAPSAITVGGLDDKNSLDAKVGELYHSTFGITALGVQKPDLIAPAIWLPAPILPGTNTYREASALCALDAMDDDMLLACAPRLVLRTSLPRSLATERSVITLRTAIAARLSAELIASPYYKMVDGTSFAAPIVASIAAQILEVCPGHSPADVGHVLTSTALLIESQPAVRQGAGVVRQRHAIAAARLCLSNK